MDDVAPSTTRRGLLATVGVGASALAGCSERLWSQAETTGPEQVSLTIKTVPADDDRLAATIASRLRENYTAAGIDATHEPVSKAELYRDILLEGEYDVFVTRHSGFDEYDALYGLLHSQFVSERGWQNPFHVSDVTIDEYLETQREADETDRSSVLADLIGHLLQTTPYTVVAYPYTVSGVTEPLQLPIPPRCPREYIEVMSHPENGPRDGPLEVGVFGEGLTEELNPLTVDRNRIDGLLDLVYDPLVRQIGDEYVPWLAEDVEWPEEGQRRARITLREGLEWHDGESLDTDDVEFTLAFLEDTSMGSVDGGVPAPRYRGRQTLLDRTAVIDDRTIDLYVFEASQTAARRLLTIPLLPAHIWTERSEAVADRQTEAITVANEDPVGSGLFAVSEATTATEFELESFDAHVLRGTADRPELLEGFSQFEGITFRIAPNPGAMGGLLIDGEIDVTASELPPETAREIRNATATRTVTGTTDAFYMIGYNSRQDELGNPNFRRLCSRLIDREHAVSEFFEGFAQPATTPNALVGLHDWDFDDELETSPDTDPLAFPGTDGEPNTSRVQSLFADIGYRYEDELLLE
ncbi:ABC transporter substrate-binding protein [Natronorubrum thiooxidans]|uniref:Peptide/nickel transport system substrate-binding protein n=1 Tax=Natronorubrum thiooxidans TaxID=308853 RepID=A0A1N7E8W9_9EURY|nr:ABC transporter substrate-binding protein [Natronorubrum thiooxidans]SIR84448.1 peptide/nickel transport system substrate-binding protein [Natronorubrum thiooxidans]